jgi:hypothetical protein
VRQAPSEDRSESNCLSQVRARAGGVMVPGVAQVVEMHADQSPSRSYANETTS